MTNNSYNDGNYYFLMIAAMCFLSSSVMGGHGTHNFSIVVRRNHLWITTFSESLIYMNVNNLIWTNKKIICGNSKYIYSLFISWTAISVTFFWCCGSHIYQKNAVLNLGAGKVATLKVPLISMSASLVIMPLNMLLRTSLALGCSIMLWDFFSA